MARFDPLLPLPSCHTHRHGGQRAPRRAGARTAPIAAKGRHTGAHAWPRAGHGAASASALHELGGLRGALVVVKTVVNARSGPYRRARKVPISCGGEGIRTLGSLATPAVFKCAAYGSDPSRPVHSLALAFGRVPMRTVRFRVSVVKLSSRTGLTGRHPARCRGLRPPRAASSGALSSHAVSDHSVAWIR
jgi:hypothetical protein